METMNRKPSDAFIRGESAARYAQTVIDRIDQIPEPPLDDYPFGGRKRRDWREGYWAEMQKRKRENVDVFVFPGRRTS
jgi:hypothetical protein